MQFPEVAGSNLQGRRFRLPTDFEGDYNVVLIAFQQAQQYDVETWLPLLRRLRQAYPALRYYELPVVWAMPRLRQVLLDMGMRLGIPSRATREKTITLYLDKSAFRRALDIPDESAIMVALVDRSGRVLWRTLGPYNEAKGASLEASVRQLPLRAL